MSVRALDIPLAPATAARTELNLLYGSHTGNGETIAENLADNARQMGYPVRLKSLADIRPAALKKMQYAAFVMSTHGDGDPPDDALDVFEWLESGGGNDLKALQFRILALGDSSYTEFCEAGKHLSRLLADRGAVELAPIVECDVDYAGNADRWSKELLEWCRENLIPDPANDSGDTPVAAPETSHSLHGIPVTPGWSRARPFPAIVERVQKITGLESDKDVYHLELSLEGSGIQYAPGDSLGVWADNDPELVSLLLRGLGIEPSELVDDDGKSRTIRDTLTRHREITRLNHNVLKGWAQLDESSSHGKLTRRLRQLPDEKRKEFLEARQLPDLVDTFPLKLSAQELADLLPPLGSRSYSIASSMALVDEEVHLTVATLHSNAIGVARRGVASNHLNHRIQTGDEIRVFLEPNKRFRLPQDTQAPVIMIGAGTGIAPYRAFMQEIEEQGTETPAWLIFGNPHQRTDFLYQREWLRWREQGLLNRIDVAFSRDQAEKRYVQHVVAEQGREIDRWIENGAFIYICGGLAMGHAVEDALAVAVAKSRGVSRDQATEIIRNLRRERRLLKDLY